MTVEELCKAARLAFGVMGGDPVVVMPYRNASHDSLLWTCEHKHMDDDEIRAHWFLPLNADGTPDMPGTPAWDDEREQWDDLRGVEVESYAILEARQ